MSGGDANLSGEQPPRVALVPRAGRHPSIVVVWTDSARWRTPAVGAVGGRRRNRLRAGPRSRQ